MQILKFTIDTLFIVNLCIWPPPVTVLLTVNCAAAFSHALNYPMRDK